MYFKISKVKENFKGLTKEDFKKILVISIVVALFVALVTGGYVYAKKDITVTVDGRVIPVETFSFTVRSALDKAGIEIESADVIEPSLDARLTEGTNIKITRALPVIVHVDGQVKEVKIANPTVESVLAELEITLGDMDKVQSNLLEGEDPLYVKITRVTQKVETREVPVDYTVKLIPADNMLRGERKVIQKGRQGLKKETYRVTYEDGNKVEEEVLKSEVIRKPVEETALFGTKKRWEPADRYKPGSPEFTPVKELEVEATAYTHTGNTTFTGIWPYVGIVAVDPKVIPLGTKMYVEGYGFAEAQDTGGAIKGEKIDVFMDTREEALKWGRKKVKVYILETLNKGK
ncbi:MAG: hypothetical protein JG764_1453 [Clostridiales bacterium]|jgi:uncharacterized protein YabE (DUF348 family)/3D (Asp-Asp-Asp) domain-containing protein|nr:hypothetical protein [Clostridiales bacterium]